MKCSPQSQWVRCIIFALTAGFFLQIKIGAHCWNDNAPTLGTGPRGPGPLTLIPKCSRDTQSPPEVRQALHARTRNRDGHTRIFHPVQAAPSARRPVGRLRCNVSRAHRVRAASSSHPHGMNRHSRVLRHGDVLSHSRRQCVNQRGESSRAAARLSNRDDIADHKASPLLGAALYLPPVSRGANHAVQGTSASQPVVDCTDCL